MIFPLIYIIHTHTHTHRYRAPELLMGAHSYTAKIDEWAVGCLALEMLCGQNSMPGRVEQVCGCPDVLHHNFNSDQLLLIFMLVGTPTNTAFLEKFACYEHFKDWDVHEPSLNEFLEEIGHFQSETPGPELAELQMPDDAPRTSFYEWKEALEGLLSIDPDTRASASEVLEMQVFAVARKWLSARDGFRPSGSSHRHTSSSRVSSKLSSGLNPGEKPHISPSMQRISGYASPGRRQTSSASPAASTAGSFRPTSEMSGMSVDREWMMEQERTWGSHGSLTTGSHDRHAMYSHDRHSMSASHGNLLSASQSGRTSPTRTGGVLTRPGDSRPRVEGLSRHFGERSNSISPLREPPRLSSSSQRSITEERRRLPSARSACIYAYMYARTHTHTRVYVYIYVYVYTRTHTHTHTCRSASSLQRMISPDPRTRDPRTSPERTRLPSYGSTRSLTGSHQYYGTGVRNPTPDVSGYQRYLCEREKERDRE